MEANDLKGLYVAALKKIHEGEKQIADALPTMAESANAAGLTQAFRDHREETRDQQRRLETILENLDERVSEGENDVVAALIRQGESVVHSDAADSVRDAGLIAAAQQVEHFEIASYGTLVTYADMLERREDSALLGDARGRDVGRRHPQPHRETGSQSQRKRRLRRMEPPCRSAHRRWAVPAPGQDRDVLSRIPACFDCGVSQVG